MQNPVRLDVRRAELQPDIAVLQPHSDFYANGHPEPRDVLLLIEIVDMSIETDRQMKLPLCAKAEIPEAWIVNLPDQTMEVYRQPTEGQYHAMQFCSVRPIKPFPEPFHTSNCKSAKLFRRA